MNSSRTKQPKVHPKAYMIYDTLIGQSFEDWHNGEFMDHVRGEKDCKNKAEILQAIEQRFRLPQLLQSDTYEGDLIY